MASGGRLRQPRVDWVVVQTFRPRYQPRLGLWTGGGCSGRRNREKQHVSADLLELALADFLDQDYEEVFKPILANLNRVHELYEETLQVQPVLGGHYSTLLLDSPAIEEKLFQQVRALGLEHVTGGKHFFLPYPALRLDAYGLEMEEAMSIASALRDLIKQTKA